MPRPLLFLLLLLAVAGCRKPAIHSYIAPADTTLDTAAPAPGAEPLPQVTWTLPAGWKQVQGAQMSLASFRAGEGDDSATVNITPLPNLSGKEDMIINMWREQVQLGPLTPDEMAEALQPVEVAGEEGKIFEIIGQREGKPSATVAVMLHRGAQSWFFKLSGGDAALAAHKPEFLAFLRSVRFNQPQSSAAAEPKSEFKWTVPPTWTAQGPGAMQVAKFSVPPQGEGKADVSVSIFPSESGGTLANVNRWRKQIGLPEIDEAALSSCTSPLDPIPGAVFVDLKGDSRALLGAIVPRGGQFFFYKLLGDAAAVGAAREDFLQFVQSAP
jgi:hypothetical protein